MDARKSLSKILGVDIPSQRFTSNIFSLLPTQAKSLVEGAQDQFRRAPQTPTVQAYADQMLRGPKFWHLSNIQVAVSGDKYWLVNGGHRLSALASLAEKAPDTKIDFILEIVGVENEAEVKSLVMAVDRPKIRTAIDTAQLSGLTEQLGMSQDSRDYRRLHAAVNQMVTGFTSLGGGARTKMAALEIYEAAALDWITWFRAYERILDDGAKSDLKGSASSVVQANLRKAAVEAIGMILLRTAGKVGQDFLKEVALGRDSSHPAIKTFVTASIDNQKALGNPAILSRVFATCWNHYAADAPVGSALNITDSRLFHYVSKKGKDEYLDMKINRIPLFLTLTPYAGEIELYYTPYDNQPVHYRVGEPHTGTVSPNDFKQKWDKLNAQPPIPAIVTDYVEKHDGYVEGIKMVAGKKRGPKPQGGTMGGTGKMQGAGGEKRGRGRPRKDQTPAAQTK